MLGEAASDSFFGICRRQAERLSGYYGIGHELLANSSPPTLSGTRIDQPCRGGRARRPPGTTAEAAESGSSKLVCPHCAVYRMAIIDRLAGVHATPGNGAAAPMSSMRME